jgi:hypothetical protein
MTNRNEDQVDRMVAFFRDSLLPLEIDEGTIACATLLARLHPLAWGKAVGTYPDTSDAEAWQACLAKRAAPDDAEPTTELSPRHAPQHIEPPEPGEDA